MSDFDREEQRGDRIYVPMVKRPAPIDAEVRELTQEIEGLMKARDERRQQAKVLREAGAPRETERKTIRDHFNLLKTQFNALKAERDALEKQREAVIERKKKQAASSKSSDRPRYRNVEEIDERIAQLEYRQGTESLDLRSERNLLKEINELNAMKSSIARAAEDRAGVQKSFEALQLQQQHIQDQLKVKRDELDAKKKEMNVQYEILQKMDGGKRDGPNPIKKLYEEADEINAKIQPLMEQRAKLRAENDERWAAFKIKVEERKKAVEEAKKQEEIAFKAQKREQRKKTLLADLTRHPWEEEMEGCEQVVQYLQRIGGSSDTAAATPAAAAAPTTLTTDDGKVLVAQPRKKDVVEDLFGLGEGSRGKKKGKGKKNKGKKAAAIRHDFQSIAMFREVGVTLPTNTDDVPAALKEAEEKLAHYKTCPPNPKRPNRKGPDYVVQESDIPADEVEEEVEVKEEKKEEAVEAEAAAAPAEEEKEAATAE